MPALSGAGLFDRMGGLPRGGPRLPDIPQMARKPADFQPYGPACGEPQRDRTGRLPAPRPAVRASGRARSSGMSWWWTAVTSLKTRAEWVREWAASTRRIGLPAEAVQKQNEALLVLEVGAVAHRHQRVLDGRRDHAEIVGVERREFQLAVHGSALQPLDVGAAGGELLLEPLVAAVEVIDAVDRRVALGGERRRGPATPRRAGRSPSPRRRAASARRAPAPTRDGW